jgi:anion-transporting  ArsA/GET3 family ATPase
MTLFERLASRQLIVVTGKGGVGKTVVTAALGSVLADLGRRVLLVEVDPRENLHQVFDAPPSGGEIVQVTPVRPETAGGGAAHGSLWLQNLQPKQVVEDLLRQHLHLELLTRRVIASPIFQHFMEGAPGLKELAVLSDAERVVRQKGKGRSSHAPFDLVVLDAPATGHGVSLLAAPHLVADVISHGPIGAQARELTTFVSDPERTAIVVVTLAEELPVLETLELREALDRLVGRTPELLVINALYPPFPATPIEVLPNDEFLIDLWRTRRQVNEREVAHLAEAWPGSRLLLRMLPADRGPRLLAGLRQQLLEQQEQTA